MWRRNPNHPSLGFHRLRGSQNRYSVRIGAHYRAVGVWQGSAMRWVWIGSHAEYDCLTKPN
jgi:hypothetical protein